MSKRKQFAVVAELVERAGHVLCVSPEDPDGDSISSCAAFRLFLLAHGKAVTLWCKDEIPDNPLMRSLPGVEHFCTEIPDKVPDLIVAFDYGSTDRLYLPHSLLAQSAFIGFDHHVSARSLIPGALAIVDHRASSTTLLLWQFFRAVGYRISQDIAWCLLVGLCTDTQFFRNSLTTPAALRMAANLAERGASLSQLSKLMRPHYSMATVSAWGEALAHRVQIHDGVALLAFSQEDFAQCEATHRDVASLVGSLLQHLEGIRVTALITEKDGQWQGSLRSPTDTVNVAKLAERFGGGGHSGAAGFTSGLSLEKICEMLFAASEE